MGMGDRNYSQWEKSTNQMSEIDRLLDTIKDHEKNVSKWENERDTIITGESEDKVQDASKHSLANDLLQKIEQERNKINSLKAKFDELSKKI